MSDNETATITKRMVNIGKRLDRSGHFQFRFMEVGEDGKLMGSWTTFVKQIPKTFLGAVYDWDVDLDANSWTNRRYVGVFEDKKLAARWQTIEATERLEHDAAALAKKVSPVARLIGYDLWREYHRLSLKQRRAFMELLFEALESPFPE